MIIKVSVAEDESNRKLFANVRHDNKLHKVLLKHWVLKKMSEMFIVSGEPNRLQLLSLAHKQIKLLGVQVI